MRNLPIILICLSLLAGCVENKVKTENTPCNAYKWTTTGGGDIQFNVEKLTEEESKLVILRKDYTDCHYEFTVSNDANEESAEFIRLSNIIYSGNADTIISSVTPVGETGTWTTIELITNGITVKEYDNVVMNTELLELYWFVSDIAEQSQAINN